MFDAFPKRDERPELRPLVLVDKIVRSRKRYRILCDKYLPLFDNGSMWRHSRGWLPTDPHQGWKIHLSATILTACDVLEIVGHYLKERGSAFKATSTLDELAKLNSGLWYGYSQVGKFLTIYPSNTEQFRLVITDLDRILSKYVEAPVVPFDHRYTPSGNIYFRFGAFVTKKVDSESGKQTAVILAPDGTLILDHRYTISPEWATPPVALLSTDESKTAKSFSNRYQIFCSISQRGKGGVYEAVDIGVVPPRLCIIKEGRKGGETAWDGRDGFHRIKHEVKVLMDLNRQGIDTPSVIDSFETAGNYYLVLEKITGNTLQKLLARRKRRLSLVRATCIGRQITGLVADIHAAGWVWRDCKPANLFVTSHGKIRPIDFEGACPIDRADLLPWNTPGYTPPEILDPKRLKNLHSNITEDLFALGICLFYLFEGKLPLNESNCSPDNAECSMNNCACATKVRKCSANNHENFHMKVSREGMPGPIKSIITRLLSDNPGKRPSAIEAFEVLRSIESHFAKQIRKTDIIADRIE